MQLTQHAKRQHSKQTKSGQKAVMHSATLSQKANKCLYY